jgi:predicted solute-binding protein
MPNVMRKSTLGIRNRDANTWPTIPRAMIAVIGKISSVAIHSERCPRSC